MESGFKYFSDGYKLLPVFLSGIHSFFYFNKNVVFLSQAEYSYFSVDFRLKIFLNYS